MLIFDVCNKSKNKTGKKTNGSLSKKNFDDKEKENQNINIKQSMKTPTKTFNDSKNTKQTKGFLMQIKIVLLKQQANKKH